MDDEDRAEAEEARNLQTADVFAGLGSTTNHIGQNESVMDIFKTAGETMGIKLMKKMGWREGQGVGPKVRRAARLEEDSEIRKNGADHETHLFAPPDSKVVMYSRKTDSKGLGYTGEKGLGGNEDNEQALPEQPDREEMDLGTAWVSKKSKKKKLEQKGGFGMGILNDNGSDDEDPYSMGPKISYNRIIGGDKKKKQSKGETHKTSSNPLLSNKPVFISKKLSATKGRISAQRCHDGRLPLDGFLLFNESTTSDDLLSSSSEHPPPQIPEGWKSTKTPLSSLLSRPTTESYKSLAEVAATAKLSPKSRAAALGEVQLPGKSVFDFLNPAARDRIAGATNNPNLPPALSEGDVKTNDVKSKTLTSLVPHLDLETAATALGRGTAGWMPYSEDLAKRSRYRKFLEICAGHRPHSTLPDRAPKASNDDWVNEMNEFVRAAQIFKPMTGTMASRFTSSSSAPKLASDNVKLDGNVGQTDSSNLLSGPSTKAKTPAEEAAIIGMYGRLTRSIETFYPSRLLCKRFNVKPPSHVQVDANDEPKETGAAFGVHSDGREGSQKDSKPSKSTTLPQKQLELIGKKDMEDLRIASRARQGAEASNLPEDTQVAGLLEQEDETSTLEIDPERNEALEKERPGDAVFKAIFGSDSEDD